MNAYRSTVVTQATGSRGGVRLEKLITAGLMNADTRRMVSQPRSSL